MEFPDGCLHELFEEQMGLTPAAVAAVAPAGSLTYADLNRRADRVASRLEAAGAGPDAVVAVLLEPSPLLPAALMGVLKAGAASLLLDPDLPAERLRWMVRDAGAIALVTEGCLSGRLGPAAVEVVRIDRDERAAPGRAAALSAVAEPENLALVGYPSGSTDAVRTTHREAVLRIAELQRERPLGAGETHRHAIGDDVGLTLLWPLAVGATAVLAGPRDPLDEVAAALGRQPGVERAVVATRRIGGEATLVAYVEAGVLWTSPGRARDALRRELPDAMVPRAWVVLDELPLTAGGTIDREALPEPEVDELQHGYVAPRDRLEARVAGIWGEIFALERVGVHDDFFDLGGHSLIALQIAIRLEALLGAPVAVAEVLDHPTVAQLAGRLRAAERPLGTGRA